MRERREAENQQRQKPETRRLPYEVHSLSSPHQLSNANSKPAGPRSTSIKDRDRRADQRRRDEEMFEARAARTKKPDTPASRLPGSAQIDVRSAYWLAASCVVVSEDM